MYEMLLITALILVIISALIVSLVVFFSILYKKKTTPKLQHEVDTLKKILEKISEDPTAGEVVDIDKLDPKTRQAIFNSLFGNGPSMLVIPKSGEVHFDGQKTQLDSKLDTEHPSDPSHPPRRN
jgi:hypothetical protein